MGNSPYSAAVGSLNVDGTPDIVVSNCFSNNTGVLLSGTRISVPYGTFSLSPGHTLRAAYTPDGASKYGSSTSPDAIAPSTTGLSTMLCALLDDVSKEKEFKVDMKEEKEVLLPNPDQETVPSQSPEISRQPELSNRRQVIERYASMRS